MNEQSLVDSIWCFHCIAIMLTVHIWVWQDFLGHLEDEFRIQFDKRYWDEAEDFIESELNRLGIRTVSDLEDDKDE